MNKTGKLQYAEGFMLKLAMAAPFVKNFSPAYQTAHAVLSDKELSFYKVRPFKCHWRC